MAGYNDTRSKILKTIMDRPNGTEIQPEGHQDFALNLLEYIRSVELISQSLLIDKAESDTTPVQPNDSYVTYVSSVPHSTTSVYTHFRDEEGNPIEVTTKSTEVKIVILIWNKQYWSCKEVTLEPTDSVTSVKVGKDGQKIKGDIIISSGDGIDISLQNEEEIIIRAIIAQAFGNSETTLMSQKTITEEFSKVNKKVGDISDVVDDLEDTVFPIVLTLSVTHNGLNHEVAFTVKRKGVDFIGDTLLLEKISANNKTTTLTSNVSPGDTIVSKIESNVETFKLSVSAKNLTAKTASVTRYICYAGGDDNDTITSEIIDSLTMYSSAGVSFNPIVKTADGQYIWIVVPSTLTINRITSQGFDVTLNNYQTIQTSLGSFKAYRTINKLTAQTWNLVIS